MNVGSIFVELEGRFSSRGFDKFNGAARQSERRMKEGEAATGRYAKSADRLEKSHGKLGHRFKEVAGAAGFLAGPLAIGGVVEGMKEAVDAAAEANKATRQTAAVLKSTGGVAKVTAKDVDELARSIQEKSGIDHVAIQQGENLLLTFKDVRNEAGKGNDIFNQTTQAAADMSAAFNAAGKSMTMGDAAMQLGKAMNDPARGMMRLQRIGVTFTKQQQDQVKALMKSGDRMGAQKIILGELTSEFGGSAAKQGTAMKRLQATLHDIVEELGQKLVPVIKQGAEKLLHFIDQMKHGKGAGGEFASIMRVVGGAISTTAHMVSGLVGWLERHHSTAKALKTILVGLVAGYVAFKAALAIGAIIEGVTGAVAALTGAQEGLNLAMMENPIAVVIAVLVALGAGLVYAYKHSAKFRQVVNGAWAAVKDGANAMWGFLKKVISWFRSAPGKAFHLVGEAAKKGLLGPLPLIIANWKKIRDFLGKTWDAIKDKAKSAFGAVKNAVKSGVSGIKDKVGGFISGVGHAVGFAEGGKVGPGAGGPKVFVAGEGRKPEYVLSHEGDRKRNIGYALAFLQESGVAQFRGGGIPGARSRIAGAHQRSAALAQAYQNTERRYSISGGATSPHETALLAALLGRVRGAYKDERNTIRSSYGLYSSEIAATRSQLAHAKPKQRDALRTRLQNLTGQLHDYRQNAADISQTLIDNSLDRMQLKADLAQAKKDKRQTATDLFEKSLSATSYDKALNAGQAALGEARLTATETDDKTANDAILAALQGRKKELQAKLGRKLTAEQAQTVQDAINDVNSSLEPYLNPDAGGTSSADQVASFNADRFDLLKSYAGLNRSGAAAALSSAVAGMGSSAGGSARGGNTVIFPTEFKTMPPDPMSWAKRSQARAASYLG